MILFKDKTYAVLKNIAQIYLPGLGALYLALAGIWDLPEAQRVSLTILALDTALGTLLGISTAAYNRTEKFAGTFQVSQDDESPHSFMIDKDLDDLVDQKQVSFKVVKAPPQDSQP